MDVLAFPLRLDHTGALATVDQFSDAGEAQLIAALVTTVRGEREMAPAFGVTDPAFDTIERAEVEAGLELFGPDVVIDAVETRYLSDTTQEVHVRYGT